VRRLALAAAALRWCRFMAATAAAAEAPTSSCRPPGADQAPRCVDHRGYKGDGRHPWSTGGRQQIGRLVGMLVGMSRAPDGEPICAPGRGAICLEVNAVGGE
jgi:hypothetical protein